MNAFADPNGDFTNILDHEPPQYSSSSNDFPPPNTSQQITALDGSELRELHANGRVISTEPQTRTKR
jgi:hypothetical protein